MNNPQGTDMIEKMARAIFESTFEEGAEGRKMYDEPPFLVDAELARKYAKAALKALSEPSEGMIEVGGKFLSKQWEGDNWTDPEKRTRWCFEAQDAFTAMINHILKEAGE